MLAERRQQRAGSMSGGEQQMLALGMALMTKPKWLLLDEPSTGLAPVIVRNVMRRLGEINERMGVGLDRGRAERPGDAQDGRADHDPALRPDRVSGLGAGTQRQYGFVEMVLSARRDWTTSPRAEAAAATRDLIAWAAGVKARMIPDAVLRRAALVLADNIAATVGAEAEPEVQAAQAKLTERSAAREATVFNRAAARADRYAAAAANGAAATWCELDEGYRLAPAHAGAYILPALLAEAEATGADTLQVLRALTLGYEIVGRCAQAFPFPAMTVHPHAAFGTLGAAAGIGLLRGYDADTLLATVSAGASMVFAGPYNHALDGALVRNLWTGLSAWAGMRAADLAPLGLGGIAESTYDVFVGCFGTRAHPSALTAQLGERWAIASGYHKLFACCQYAHSAVEASLALGEKLAGTGRTSDDIAEITVETHPRGLTLTENESADRALRQVLDAARDGGRGGAPHRRAERIHVRHAR